MEKICLRSDFFPHLIFSLNDEHPLNFSLYKINKESTSSLASLSRNRKGKGSHADPRECLSLETPKKSRPENKKAPTTVSLSKKLEREWDGSLILLRLVLYPVPLSQAILFCTGSGPSALRSNRCWTVIFSGIPFTCYFYADSRNKPSIVHIEAQAFDSCRTMFNKNVCST